MSVSRMKLPAVITTIVGAGLALLAWSQTWFDLELADAAAHGAGDAIAVPGSVASPALAALGLAGLALVAALAIAGPVIRIILGVLEVVLGGCVLLATWLTLGDPVAAVSPAVTDATGVSGSEPTAELVASVDQTLWPVAAIIGGILLVAAGIVVLVTGTRWPASSRRYRAARLADAGEPVSAAVSGRAASDRAIDDWDELSRGDDPTGDGPTGEPRDGEAQAEPNR
ncbi:Trp biosynthesis-associated membrane protein [Agromyces sp. NPDC058484]|uniref:Trp biosynthesis-associated membrane protein n=1 Tax=Agromyces sp. NPDC058484 TaxID=3346524 RepID=UPI0036613FB9